MKTISHLRIERAVWIIGLILAALILGGASSTHAQTSQHRIILSDADGNFEQALAQPAEFLKNSGLSLEDILKLSNTRAAIQIRGAGFVRNFGLMGPEDVQNLQAATLRIGLVGAGAIGRGAFDWLPFCRFPTHKTPLLLLVLLMLGLCAI